MKQTTAYKCEHCNKLYQRKHNCEKHELICKKNPANYQKCTDGCIHLEQKEITVNYQKPVFAENLSISYEDATMQKKAMFCNKHEIFVYPFWCKKPILQEDIDNETPNEPMPKECKYYDVEF